MPTLIRRDQLTKHMPEPKGSPAWERQYGIFRTCVAERRFIDVRTYTQIMEDSELERPCYEFQPVGELFVGGI